MHRPHISWRHILPAALLITLLSGSTLFAAPILRPDSHGPDVIRLQKNLQRAGYSITKISGIYDNDTKRAVLAFQRDQHMKITGIADGDTWRALETATPGKEVPSVQPLTTGSTAGTPATAEKPQTSSASTREPLVKPLKKVPETKPFLPESQVSRLLSTAKQYIGVPYKFGGTTPKAFDCSGYLQYDFARNGLSLPRTADEQYKLGQRTTSIRQLVPGDLVFFTTYEPGASHCGIYLGDGRFIHASTSKGVRIDELSNTYWQPRFYGGKHIVQ